MESPNKQPLPFEDLKEGMYVLFRYEGTKKVGVVRQITPTFIQIEKPNHEPLFYDRKGFEDLEIIDDQLLRIADLEKGMRVQYPTGRGGKILRVMPNEFQVLWDDIRTPVVHGVNQLLIKERP